MAKATSGSERSAKEKAAAPAAGLRKKAGPVAQAAKKTVAQAAKKTVAPAAKKAIAPPAKKPVAKKAEAKKAGAGKNCGEILWIFSKIGRHGEGEATRRAGAGSSEEDCGQERSGHTGCTEEIRCCKEIRASETGGAGE